MYSLENMMLMISINQHVLSLNKIRIDRLVLGDGDMDRRMVCCYCGCEVEVGEGK